MFAVPEKIKGITHPLVKDVYLKKDFGARHRGEDVLVIETMSSNDNKTSGHSFSELLEDLLDIQTKAEHAIGHIDRVDIVAH